MKPVSELTTKEVQTYMDAVIEVVSPSPISSHVKGEVICLLEFLRDEEILRRVKSSKKSDVQKAAEKGFSS